MKSWRWRGPIVSCTIVLFVTMTCGITGAQDNAEGQLDSGKLNPSRIEFVVLKSGNVFSGILDMESGQFIVRGPAGTTVRLGRNEVDFVAGTMYEAYQQMHSRLAKTDVAGHFKLANWCLKYRDARSATEQIEWLAKISNRPRAVALLEKQLASLSQGNKQDQIGLLEPKKDRLDSLPTNIPGNISNDDLVALVDSFPKDAIRRFNRDIHPKMMNGCAVTGCHSRPDSKMRLWRGSTVRGIHSKVVQRNLHAFMSHVDHTRPERSHILEFMAVAHGGQKRAAFEMNSQQYLAVKSWIERAVALQSISANRQTGSESIRQTAFVETESAPQTLQPADQGSRQEFKPPSPVDLNREPTRFVARDPYDPEIFNRRFHSNENQDSKPAAPSTATANTATANTATANTANANTANVEQTNSNPGDASQPDKPLTISKKRKTRKLPPTGDQ